MSRDHFDSVRVPSTLNQSTPVLSAVEGGDRNFAPTVLGITLLTVGALALRFWNIGFGLPEHYHPDEPFKAAEILRIASGDLAPTRFYHPSFLLYAGAAVFRIMVRMGWPAELDSALLAGRSVSAILGALTVPLTWLLGRRFSSGNAGWIAAGLVAVAPVHVVCSHYLKEDVAMTFWSTATFVVALRIAAHSNPGPRVWWADAFGSWLAGMATGTKYTGLLFLGLILLAQRESFGNPLAVSLQRPRLKRALVWFAFGFLCTTPFAVLALPNFLFGLGHEGSNALTGIGGVAVWPLPYFWSYHLLHNILPGLGWLPTALAVIGLILALRTNRAEARLLSTMVVMFYVILESSPYKPFPNSERYIVPLIPLLAVLAGDAIVRISAGIPLSSNHKFPVVVAVLAVTFLPALRSLDLTRAMATDTRATTALWLIAGPCRTGQRILLEGALRDGDHYKPAYVPLLPANCRAEYTYSLIRERERFGDFDLLVASSFTYDRYLEIKGAPADQRDFYTQLFATNAELREISDETHRVGFQSPTIRILSADRAAAQADGSKPRRIAGGFGQNPAGSHLEEIE